MDLTFVKGNLPPEVPPAITRSDCDRAVALHGWRFALCFQHLRIGVSMWLQLNYELGPGFGGIFGSNELFFSGNRRRSPPLLIHPFVHAAHAAGVGAWAFDLRERCGVRGQVYFLGGFVGGDALFSERGDLGN
jgi:hypothetical protein